MKTGAATPKVTSTKGKTLENIGLNNLYEEAKVSGNVNEFARKVNALLNKSEDSFRKVWDNIIKN